MSKRMMMPQNKREDLIFTILMVFAMAICMITYNMFQVVGLRWEAIRDGWCLLPLTFCVCFCIEHFAVSKLVTLIVRKVMRPTAKPFFQTLCFQFVTVCCMVVIMSFYGALLGVGFTNEVWLFWLHHIPLNFIVALPLQVLVLGPLIRLLFRALIPVGQLHD